MTLLMMAVLYSLLLGPTHSLLSPNILKYFVLIHPQTVYLKHVSSPHSCWFFPKLLLFQVHVSSTLPHSEMVDSLKNALLCICLLQIS
jgi:hypothetical protein